MPSLRRAAWLLGGAGSGLVGYFVGFYQTEKAAVRREEASLLSDPRIAEFVARLKAKGYVEDQQSPSAMLQLHRQYMFTQAVLSGANKLDAEGPLALRTPEGSFATIFHLGPDLQPKQAFASMCTTLFDESLAMAAFPKLPNQIGVTGTLELSPIRASPPKDGLVVLYAEPTTARGRRSESKGELVALSSGQHLATGRAVMIEPWWGKYISIFA